MTGFTSGMFHLSGIIVLYKLPLAVHIHVSYLVSGKILISLKYTFLKICHKMIVQLIIDNFLPHLILELFINLINFFIINTCTLYT